MTCVVEFHGFKRAEMSKSNSLEVFRGEEREKVVASKSSFASLSPEAPAHFKECVRLFCEGLPNGLSVCTFPCNCNFKSLAGKIISVGTDPYLKTRHGLSLVTCTAE